MRNNILNIRSYFLIFFAGLILMGCKKNDNGGNTPIVPGIAMMVDGSEWKADSYTASLNSGKFRFTGTHNDQELEVTIHGDQAANYTLNPAMSEYGFEAVFRKSSGTPQELAYHAEEGMLTLGQIDATLDHITGSFSFRGNSVEVSERSFTAGIFDQLTYTTGSKTGCKGGTISMMADTAAWLSVNQMTVLQNHQFAVTGMGSAGDILHLGIKGTNPGTYILNDSTGVDEFTAVWKPSSSALPSETYGGIFGNLQLSAIDTVAQTISGSFWFQSRRVSTSNVNISSGTFTLLKFLR